MKPLCFPGTMSMKECLSKIILNTSLSSSLCEIKKKSNNGDIEV